MTRLKIRAAGMLLLGLLCAAPLLLPVHSSGSVASSLPPGPVSIEILSLPLDRFDMNDPARRSFGMLEFRGGMILSSGYKAFGGISALRIQPDGAHFIALSDRSLWLSGRIVYSGRQPSGIADAVMAPVLDSRGRNANWDTESMAQDDGRIWVGVEGLNRIFQFNYGKNGLLARGEPIAVPLGVSGLPSNQGLEALVFVPRTLFPGGALLAFSERGLTRSGDLQAFIIGGPNPGMFAVKRTDEFDISDAALMPGGDLLILERRFSLLGGVGMRIRRIPLKEIRPRALVDGAVLIESGMDCQIDNMEALSVNRIPSGETILTLMSDDNFSALQRTLLLQFKLADDGASPASSPPHR